MSVSYDEWACPLRAVEWHYDEETGNRLENTTVDCGATLHLSWSCDWPVPDDDQGHPFTREEVALNAYTDSWEVVCEEGHTLARSRPAEDSAEPFDLFAVMGAIGAKKVTRDV